jgi:tRNA-2-methylthio-N6-dimethylallyladenosine synthase
MSAPRKVYVDTYGCQMNVLDSELVRGQLEAKGYAFAPSAQDADVVLLNTCSVRALSEQKIWSELGRLAERKRDNPELVVGVLGCMAEREGQKIQKRMPHVDIVCGPSNLDQLPVLLENVALNQGPQLVVAGHTSRRSKTLEAAVDGVEALDLSRAFSPTENKFQAYARITRGCNKFCSFCVVPYTRGPEVHRAPEQIIDEVRKLWLAGAQEVTLIGQTVNHYEHHDGGRTTSFAELLWRVHEEVPELPRLRFVTSYPRDFTDEALDVMARAPRICKYLHVPAQSGSNRLLRLMNRGYTVEDYLGLIERARARMPDIRIAGDMMVGFPTETEEDHQASLELLRRVSYKNVFIFKYSPRDGTVAQKRLADDVPEEDKRRRNTEMLEVQAHQALANHQRLLGTTVTVLVEREGKEHAPRHDGEVRLGWGRGHKSAGHVRLIGRTEGDEIVAFDGPRELVGTLVRVRPQEATPLSLFATLAEAPPLSPSASPSAAL